MLHPNHNHKNNHDHDHYQSIPFFIHLFINPCHTIYTIYTIYTAGQNPLHTYIHVCISWLHYPLLIVMLCLLVVLNTRLNHCSFAMHSFRRHYCIMPSCHRAIYSAYFDMVALILTLYHPLPIPPYTLTHFTIL